MFKTQKEWQIISKSGMVNTGKRDYSPEYFHGSERFINDQQRIPTLLHMGYQEYVSYLYNYTKYDRFEEKAL